MKNQILIITIFLLVITLTVLSADERARLEDLWNSALSTNIDIHYAETESENLYLNRKYFNSLYAPSLVLTSSNTFAPNPQREDGTLSDRSIFSLLYGQQFTGGLFLNVSLDYSLSRTYTSEGIYAIQSPNVKINMSQGIHPWWLQGLQKNPALSLLENQLQYQEIKLVKQKKEILIYITDRFIELRKTERAISLLENTIALHRDILSSLNNLYEQGGLTLKKIWEEEQILMDEENKLIAKIGDRDRIKEQIRSACGITPEVACSLMLPNILPQEWNPELSINQRNLDIDEIESQKKSILYSQAERKQNNAPTVTFSADVSLPLENEKLSDWNKAWATAKDDNQKPLYTLSLGIDLSPLLASTSKRDLQIDENKLIILNDQQKTAYLSEENQKRLLKTHLASLRMQTKQSRIAAFQTTSLLEDTELLALQGAITDIELRTYRNQNQQREAELADNEDQLWYVEWYLQWWMDMKDADDTLQQ